MSSDYISRQMAIDEAYPIYIDGESFDVVQVETLMGMPSADVEPVRHGHWIYTPTNILGYVCSECGNGMCRFNYCPHCGALMEEVT